MEGRCAVETWAEFGFSGAPCTQMVKSGLGTEVFLCTGGDEVYVFCSQERKLTTVFQFPSPVSHLVESHDNQLLYVACRSGVYCVNLQLMLNRARSSPADVSSSPTELKISSKSLVVAEEGVLSLLLVSSVLLTLSQRDTSWMLTLYDSAKQSASSSYVRLTSFSLPLVSGVINSAADRKAGKTRRPVLICVRSNDKSPSQTSSTPPSETSLTDGHVHLEPVLFKLLFGIDAALARSPVILCGLPDGCLCFLPLSLPGSRLQVLHGLEQPVVFVGASVTMAIGPGHAQCLVAMGELGRVVLIKTDKGGPEGGGNTARFIERCVPGPVMCGCVDKNCLYYSTGSDLLVLDLSQGSFKREGNESTEETSTNAETALQSPVSLNVCRVVALAEPKCNTTGEVELLGLTVRGQLQRITLPERREDMGLYKVPSTQMGHSVRDLLAAIGDVCERASTLKTAIKSKNQILRHLNQVLNISFLLIGSSNSEEKPIRCHATTKWFRLLQEDSLNLICVLKNSSPYVLERGWTLNITVFPLSHSICARGESPSTNFSFPFHGLHPGETLEVSLPLTAADDTSFPMTVSCSLVFLLSSFQEEEPANLPGLQSSCISLPLNMLTVDWLHALQVNSPIVTPKKATMDTIQAFISSCQLGCSGRRARGGESTSKTEPEHYSASVRVSSELLRDTLILKTSCLEPHRLKLAPQNVCLSLLEWLLSEGHGGVTTGHRGHKISSSLVQARSPDGHMVKITAKEVSVGEESVGKEECSTVEVLVESSSVAAVCGLHHAVLRRVQTLLQRAPESAASTKKVHSLGLRQALQQAEHLLQQIQQTRVSGAFSVGASTGQMTRSLLSIYRELRENPLLII